MINLGYIYLGIAALLPVVASIIIFLLNNKIKTRLPYAVRQAIIGVVFGAIAIIGTEWGIELGGFVVNCRDAAVLSAGLIFGGPAGIIAGLIGGVERYIAAAWGAGYYTQIGCSLSTILAGFFAAFIRRYQLEDNRPNWAIAFLSGLVMESIHMVLVFVTHLDDVPNALDIILQCGPPMMIYCSFSVMLSVIVVDLLDRKPDQNIKSVRQLFQGRILINFVIVFVIFSGLAYATETIVCTTANEQYLERNLTNIKEFNLSLITGSSNKTPNELSGYRKIGDSGYILLSQLEDGKIISGPDSLNGKTMQEIGLGQPQDINYNTSTNGAADCSNIYDATIDGVSCECMDSYSGNYRLTAVYPTEEGYLDRDRASILILLIQVLLFGAIFILSDLIIKRNVVEPIHKVNKSLQKITDGDLDTVVDEKSSLEFVELSSGINETVDALQRYNREAQERMEKELELAHNIQHSALPKNFSLFSDRNEFDIYASMETAKKVGGDFYDFYFTDNNTFNFLIADVSGKGIPAAMFMMRAKTQIKDLMETGLSLDEVIRRTNVLLCEDNQISMFVTLWLGSINLETGVVTYVNAGHNSPVTKYYDGKVEIIDDRHNFVLGVFDKVTYDCKQIQLHKGDTLFLYTDGITEAMTKEVQLFGNDRMLSSLSRASSNSMKEMCNSVRSDIEKFVKGAPQSDDITMLGFRYLGSDNTDCLIVPAKKENTKIVKDFIVEKLKDKGAEKKSIRRVSVVLDELIHNVVDYAYPDNEGTIKIDYNITQDVDDPHKVNLSLTITDSGEEFNPLEQKPPNTNASANERISGGYGIFITKKIADNIKYKRENENNILTIDIAIDCE